MSYLVYILCGAFSVVCALMLFRRYLANHSNLLLWSSLCFLFLSFNNVFLVFDMVLFPEVDFNGSLWRNLLGAIAGSLLLFGLIWEVT